MQIANRITPAVIQAATAMLSPYVPEISPTGLVAALKDYKASDRRPAEEKPYTRAEVADLLGLSIQTINRMLNRGALKRIRVGERAVRIDRQSVRAILEGQTGADAARQK